jgi:UDP-glucose 4-epimerase
VAQTPGLTGVFNAGYGEQSSVLALAQRIIALTHSSSTIVFAPERVGDVRHSRANVDRLRAAGWHPTGSLDLGLAHLCAHLRRT